MAIRSSTVNTGASSTSVIGNLPAGTTTGDLLLAFVQIRTRSVTFTPPTGWTEIYHFSSGSGPQATIACFWLAPGASEPSTYTFTASLAGSYQTELVAMTGMNTTSPADVSATNFVTTTTSPAAPSVTTTVANDVLFCQYATDATTSMTAATGQTIIDTPASQHVITNSETIASAGATGTRTATGTSLKYLVAQVALKVAVSGGATVNPNPATQGAVLSPSPAVAGGSVVAAPVGTSGAALAPVATPKWVVPSPVATASSAAVAPSITTGAATTSPVGGAGSISAPGPTVTGSAVAMVAAPVVSQGSIAVVTPAVQGLAGTTTVTSPVVSAKSVAVAPLVTVIAPTYRFTPPTTRLHYGNWFTQPLTSRIGIPTGATVIKTGGFYSIRWDSPSQADINAADIVYLGGHTYTISQAEANALTAAGYGSNITTG